MTAQAEEGGVSVLRNQTPSRRRKSERKEPRTLSPLLFAGLIYFSIHTQKERETEREKTKSASRRRGTLRRAEKERATFKEENHDRRHGDDAFARERRRDEADHAESVRGNQTVRGEARTGRPGGGFTGTVPNERFV